MTIPALQDSNFSITVQLPNTPHSEATDKVKEALSKEGFGILTEVDVQATMKNKLGVDEREYTILGACNPQLAHQVLSQLPSVGVLLPCSVVIAADDNNGSSVAIIDPVSMFKMVGDAHFTALADEARVMLKRALNSLL